LYALSSLFRQRDCLVKRQWQCATPSIAKAIAKLDGGNFNLGIQLPCFYCPLDQVKIEEVFTTRTTFLMAVSHDM
jgi:hypothetical protein